MSFLSWPRNIIPDIAYPRIFATLFKSWSKKGPPNYNQTLCGRPLLRKQLHGPMRDRMIIDQCLCIQGNISLISNAV